MATQRVLTGMRTTGSLHLGHYVGALKQWLEVVSYNEYECFFLLADVQALTTHADKPSILTQSVRDCVLDWLAIGLLPEPGKVHFVLQSQVQERYELSALLMMLAKYNEVRRNPTLKAELKGESDSVTMGFMCYPVDQVADICMVSPTPPQYGDELLVPVGEDQVPHLEYAKRLAVRFNDSYGRVFVPCKALVGQIGRLVGTDGQDKMSKSLGNTINLNDNADTVRRKIMAMYTDPKRLRATDPGTVEGNPVFIYHDALNPNLDEVNDLKDRYRIGKVGDVEVKHKLIEAVNTFLDPIRERRIRLQNTDIRELLITGTDAARNACKPVVAAVRDYMFLKLPT